MTELFDIFGERSTKESTRSILRQPLSNNENIGKVGSNGPIKPNEPLKKTGDMKKSFLSNTGKALLDIQTSVQKPLSPRMKNIESSARKILHCQIILSEDKAKEYNFEELEFTRPTYRYDNYHADLIDYMFDPEPLVLSPPSPPNTPPPGIRNWGMEYESSYEDEFFTDDFAKDSECSPFGEDSFSALFSDSD